MSIGTLKDWKKMYSNNNSDYIYWWDYRLDEKFFFSIISIFSITIDYCSSQKNIYNNLTCEIYTRVWICLITLTRFGQSQAKHIYGGERKDSDDFFQISTQYSRFLCIKLLVDITIFLSILLPQIQLKYYFFPRPSSSFISCWNIPWKLSS